MRPRRRLSSMAVRSVLVGQMLAQSGETKGFPDASPGRDLDQWAPVVALSRNGERDAMTESRSLKNRHRESMTKAVIRILQIAIAGLIASSTVTTVCERKPAGLPGLYQGWGMIVGVGGGEGGAGPSRPSDIPSRLRHGERRFSRRVLQPPMSDER